MKSDFCILNTAYLPNIDYFLLITKFQNVVIEANENYSKQSFRNRCSILSPNGVIDLTIPILKNYSDKINIAQCRTSENINWRILHWRAIETAYNSSPYFLYYKDTLKSIYYSENSTHLLKFNSDLTTTITKMIGINTKFFFSEEYLPSYSIGNDYRQILHPKKKNLLDNEKYIPYSQVFDYKFGFVKNLSIIDLLFSMGPETLHYLKKMTPTSE